MSSSAAGSAREGIRRGEERRLVHATTGMELRFVRTAAETGGAELELEVTYPPRSAPPPRHLHPRQEEEFEVVSGLLTVELDGEAALLRPGPPFPVPPGTPHAMWNAQEAPCVARWVVRPALATESFFRDVYALAAAGRTDAHGAPGLRDLAWLVPRYRHEIRVVSPPYWAQRLLFALLWPLRRAPIR